MKTFSENLYKNKEWLMNKKEISKFVKLSERTISTLIAVDDFPHLRVKGRILFDPFKVMEFMKRYEVNGETSKWDNF